MLASSRISNVHQLCLAENFRSLLLGRSDIFTSCALFLDSCDMMTNPSLARPSRFSRDTPAAVHRITRWPLSCLLIKVLIPPSYMCTVQTRRRVHHSMSHAFFFERRETKRSAKGFCSGPCWWNKTIPVRLTYMTVGVQEITARRPTATAKYTTVRGTSRASYKPILSSARSRIGRLHVLDILSA